AACPGFGTCGALCDGSSPTQCTYAAATTTCGKSTCAVDGEQLSAPLCNGAGACLPAVGTNCGAYTCDPSSGSCQTSCVIASDCAAGFDCVNSKCVATNDAGVVDSGAAGAPEMPDSSMTDASQDGMAPDAMTDAAMSDSGDAGGSDAGPALVPPNHSTDKGSCGCSVPGSDTGSSNIALLAGLTLLGIASRRRRRGERDARL
ncbi:MAG TPA: MYXO-CTERM sorting domain-containing protein, partial [Polyangiaceae bacterium]|nr:MYXO-CTERM sorting domain-containing protein [Polyangiaceae bacterium]